MGTIVQPRTAVITIYQGDYLDRLRHLERRHDAAVKAEKLTPTLDETSEAEEIAAEHRDLLAEAEASAIHVKVQAFTRRKWRELVKAHPPRMGNETDQASGINDETFKDALPALAIVEPEMTDEEKAEFLDSIADVDYDRIYYTAFALNRAPAADPKHLGSRQSQQNGATSS